jgi:hypothetical protein
MWTNQLKNALRITLRRLYRQRQKVREGLQAGRFS